VARSYTDNGDGTITDNETGLMWEKKSYAGSVSNNTKSFIGYVRAVRGGS
jgi:hypothetical protein